MMSIGPDTWFPRMLQAYEALSSEQQSIIMEVQQLKGICTDPAQLARLERLEARGIKHASTLNWPR